MSRGHRGAAVKWGEPRRPAWNRLVGVGNRTLPFEERPMAGMITAPGKAENSVAANADIRKERT